jgi:uncharacterized OB-fold protein
VSQAQQTGSSAPTRIPPFVDAESRFFWEAADQGRFVGQRCGDCGKFTFPPRPMCPFCHSLKREVAELSGLGSVLSWVVPRHPPAFGFDEAPIVALIDLKEDIRFVSNLVDVSLADLRLGMPVKVLFVPTTGNHQVPVFKPA